MADATTVYVDQYGLKFTTDESKRLIEYFESRHDIKGNFKYRMFNKFSTFKDAVSEHTEIKLSRIHENQIKTVTVDFFLRPTFVPPTFTTVEFFNPSLKDISNFYDHEPFLDDKTPNLVIMTIVEAEGAKHTKNYEACIYNPEFDLVTDSIRFVVDER
jgi:hypothetical protein